MAMSQRAFARPAVIGYIRPARQRVTYMTDTTRTNNSAPDRAVVLLSGGLDSATALAIAKAEGYAVWAVSFDYGQRHRVELEAARRVAISQGVREHRIVACDLRSIGGSALTDEIAVPKDSLQPGVIPTTYVPARNTIFLSLALGYAEVVGARTIIIGANAIDYSGYPDCRPDYLKAFETMANLATKAGVEGRTIQIYAPLIHLTKAEIIRKGIELAVDYRLTFSCYDPDSLGRACGHCDSCLLRKKGFAEAGVTDPTVYSGSAEAQK